MTTVRISIILVMILTSVPARAVVDGVGQSGDVSPASAKTNGMSFDPPCAFADTLPLMAAPYMDPGTQAAFVDGEGAVINECGNFRVTGYSKPNFLAFNCTATNLDGTKPALPLEIRFSKLVASVSIKVASSGNAGSTATLRVYNAAHAQTGAASVVLSSAAKTLSLTRTGTRYMRVEGPCVMIIDDLAYF